MLLGALWFIFVEIVYTLALNELEKDLAKKIVGDYKGHLVFIDTEKMSPIELSVLQENNLKIRIEVEFPVFSKVILFGHLSEQHEGVLICLDQKALPRSISVIGISGILENKPNVHGGLMNTGSLILSLRLQDERMKELTDISILCEKI